MDELFKKALTLITGSPGAIQNARPLHKLTERDLIRLESEIGRELFGPIPAGHRREFFNLDPTTWIWYEEWVDAETGRQRSLTTRYEVHPSGILKVQDGQQYHFIDDEEQLRLTVAVYLYYERVMREIYKRDPATGHLLPEAYAPVTIVE